MTYASIFNLPFILQSGYPLVISNCTVLYIHLVPASKQSDAITKLYGLEITALCKIRMVVVSVIAFPLRNVHVMTPQTSVLGSIAGDDELYLSAYLGIIVFFFGGKE